MKSLFQIILTFFIILVLERAGILPSGQNIAADRQPVREGTRTLRVRERGAGDLPVQVRWPQGGLLSLILHHFALY